MSVQSVDAVDTLGPEASIRQDRNGRWHQVGSAPCEECGCLYDFSTDELGIIWEAGPSIAADCLDPLCDCHVTPILGTPFHVTTKSGRDVA